MPPWFRRSWPALIGLVVVAFVLPAAAASPRRQGSSSETNLLARHPGARMGRGASVVVRRSPHGRTIVVRRASARRTYWAYRTPPPVRVTQQGSRYVVTARLRTGSRRELGCVVMRELLRHRVVIKGKRCVRSRSRWHHVRLTLDVRG